VLQYSSACDPHYNIDVYRTPSGIGVPIPAALSDWIALADRDSGTCFHSGKMHRARAAT